jgi:hypothetical protein
MFGWWRKRRKRWNRKWNPRSFSTAELQVYHQIELELVSYRARPVYEYLANVAQLENELARRNCPID